MGAQARATVMVSKFLMTTKPPQLVGGPEKMQTVPGDFAEEDDTVSKLRLCKKILKTTKTCIITSFSAFKNQLDDHCLIPEPI